MKAETTSHEITPALRIASARGRWVIAATVLGSGVAFLDGTVVNVALPAIGRDFHAGLAGLQWVLSGYLLTLGSLIVLGGSLGDLHGRRRIFVAGLVGFAITSTLCAFAPTVQALIVARVVQGIAAAMLVPGSLAITSASFHPDDRGRAIGAWSGLAGVSTAVGPFLGGWLIDAFSWRFVFFVNVPLVVVAVAIALRWVPETRDDDADPRVDVAGALTLSLGLAAVVYAMIEGPGNGWSAPAVTIGGLGVLALIAFAVVEQRSTHPMVPLDVFRSHQFSGANAVTLVVYGALGVTTFLLVVQLQENLGYDALTAGASLLPITVLMLAFSSTAGAFGQRIGPRVPMTVGPVVIAVGLVLLRGVDRGSSYWSGVFPGLMVLGAGLTITVAPLTTAVLGAVEDRHAGIGSAINNAVARVASLLTIAVLPGLVGVTGSATARALAHGFGHAMDVSAVLAASGGVLAVLTIRRAAPIPSMTHGSYLHACEDAAVRSSPRPRHGGRLRRRAPGG